MTDELRELQQLLEQTYADRLLDNAERANLASLCETMTPDKARYLRNRAFDMVRDCVRNGGENAMNALKWLEKVIRTLDRSAPDERSTIDVHFSPGESCRRMLLDQLQRVRSTADICVFTISDDRLADGIVSAHRRGVSVRIISDNDKAFDDGSDLDHLRSEGIPVRTDRSSNHMHHKFALFDNRSLINGSFNWTRSASSYNQENLVVLRDASLIRSFAAEFERLWDQFA